MAKNVLRDNKAIVKRITKGYRDSADNLDSYVFVMFLDSGCILNFEYKDYKYSYVINGLSLYTESDDIKVVEHKGKGIICLDTNNIFKLSRLRDDGILIYPNDISISNVLHNMANLVYKDLLNRFSKFGLLEDLMSFYTAKYGEFCDDLDSFLKLFIKYNYPNMVSVLQDYISTLSIDNYMGRVSKTMYVQDGLIGVCCFNFKDDLVTSPLYSKISMSDLQVFTTSVNQLSIRLLNISSILSNKNKIDCEFLKLNLRISNNSQFMSDDGMIKLGVD